MSDSLLSEVDADVRAERIHQLWMRHRMTLAAAVVAIILATVVSTLWQNYEEKRGGELLLRFTDAQALYEQAKYGDAAEKFAGLSHDTSGQLRTLAELWQARALGASGKKDEAIALLKPASESATGIWSDIACLRLASLDMAQASCLDAKKDSPLANQRNEWRAAHLWATGKKDEAVALLEQLQTSPDSSESTRAVTAEWLATMRAEMPPVAETPAKEDARP